GIVVLVAVGQAESESMLVTLHAECQFPANSRVFWIKAHRPEGAIAIAELKKRPIWRCDGLARTKTGSGGGRRARRHSRITRRRITDPARSSRRRRAFRPTTSPDRSRYC